MGVRCQRGDGWGLLVFFFLCSFFPVLPSLSCPHPLLHLFSLLSHFPLFFLPFVLSSSHIFLSYSSFLPFSLLCSFSPLFSSFLLFCLIWRQPPPPQSPGEPAAQAPPDPSMNPHPSLSPQPISHHSPLIIPRAVFHPKTLRHGSAASPQGRG